MGLTADDRAELLNLASALGPEADPDEVASLKAFLADRGERAVSELSDDPGFDQVRAILLRALRLLGGLGGDDAGRGELDAVARILEAFPGFAARAEPTVFLQRHPAWVGLSRVELGALNHEDPAAAATAAAALARSGFQALSKKAPTGEGEVLWALAEQAEDAGWTDLAGSLLDQAAISEFSSPEQAVQLKLLVGLRRAESGQDGADELLLSVAAEADEGTRARIHALWVVGNLRAEVGRHEDARGLWRTALDEVDLEAEPEVARRIQEALASLGREADA